MGCGLKAELVEWWLDLIISRVFSNLSNWKALKKSSL